MEINSDLSFYMPTRIVSGTECLIEHSHYLNRWGRKALIVTGLHSNKLDGSLDDVISALEHENIKYKIFDGIDDHPTIELIQRAFDENQREGIDFIVGLGKGACLDAAKAIGVLFRNRGLTAREAFNLKNLRSIPIIAVPTTAGTGSEVTPYSIVTDHQMRTKKDFGQESYPKVAYCDPAYLYLKPFSELLHNAFDAFSHLVEGYLNVQATLMSDLLAEQGFRVFRQLAPSIKRGSFGEDDFSLLLTVSTLGGMVISQTGTSLPHALGYVLTYEKGIPHGIATAAIYKGYLASYQDSDKLNRLLQALGYENTQELLDFIASVMEITIPLSDAEITEYTRKMIHNMGKLKNHPERVSRHEIELMYQKVRE